MDLIVASPTTSKPRPTDQFTELLWEESVGDLHLTNYEILLPMNIAETIGDDNIEKLKARLRNLIHAPTVGFRDESIGAYRIMESPVFAGQLPSVLKQTPTTSATEGKFGQPVIENGRQHVISKALKKEAEKVPRPPNSFILYRQHHHSMTKEAHPDIRNSEISILLGRQWKNESEATKSHFKALAEGLKHKYVGEQGNRQYVVHKRPVKKRRYSSRKGQYVSHLERPLSSAPRSSSDEMDLVANESANADSTSPDDISLFSGIEFPKADFPFSDFEEPNPKEWQEHMEEAAHWPPFGEEEFLPALFMSTADDFPLVI